MIVTFLPYIRSVKSPGRFIHEFIQYLRGRSGPGLRLPGTYRYKFVYKSAGTLGRHNDKPPVPFETHLASQYCINY